MNMTAPQRDLEFALIKFHFVVPQWAKSKSYFYTFFSDSKKHLNGDSLGGNKTIFSTALLGQLLQSTNIHAFIFVLIPI